MRLILTLHTPIDARVAVAVLMAVVESDWQVELRDGGHGNITVVHVTGPEAAISEACLPATISP